MDLFIINWRIERVHYYGVAGEESIALNVSIIRELWVYNESKELKCVKKTLNI